MVDMTPDMWKALAIYSSIVASLCFVMIVACAIAIAAQHIRNRPRRERRVLNLGPRRSVGERRERMAVASDWSAVPRRR